MSEALDLSPLMDGVLRDRTARTHEQEAYLPSPSPQNHAANLIRLGDGRLACVWFGGTQEGMADISIHFATLDSRTGQWSAAAKLVDDPQRSEQNPILFPAMDGALWLLYTSQKSGNQDTALVRRRLSRDHGETWSAPETMIGDAGTFVRQPILARPDGTLLLGTFLCRTTPGVKWVGDNDISALRRSVDGGRTWQRIEVPQSLGAVHMNVVEAGSAGLVAFFRSRWADFIHVSRSIDDGLSWSPPRPSALPNNNSSIQATGLHDGRIALVYNHASAADAKERRLSLYDEIEDDYREAAPVSEPVAPPARTAFWGAPRAPVVLALSSDGGETFAKRLIIEDGDGYCMTNNSADRRNRELSYPSLHESKDGGLDIAFTFHRQGIKHVHLAPDHPFLAL